MHMFVSYFACSMFACNPMRLSLESIKANLRTYLLNCVIGCSREQLAGRGPSSGNASPIVTFSTLL